MFRDNFHRCLSYHSVSVILLNVWELDALILTLSRQFSNHTHIPHNLASFSTSLSHTLETVFDHFLLPMWFWEQFFFSIRQKFRLNKYVWCVCVVEKQNINISTSNWCVYIQCKMNDHDELWILKIDGWHIDKLEKEECLVFILR